ncbi:hypothetical protein [Leptotrichia shahii]|uniref:hypothetical protein n=1 Tax=Leptotrichia shahii TaxID=157691 RepID=UPI0028D0F184|nr:hypothetical protein [Leptotrichia shahii]
MACYAHYALHKLKILPHDFANMTLKQQAFIIASIRIKTKDEEKQLRESKSKTGRRRR